jgi:hypothetical protein
MLCYSIHGKSMHSPGVHRSRGGKESSIILLYVLTSGRCKDGINVVCRWSARGTASILLARVSQKKSDSRYTVVCASTMLLKTTATFPFLCVRLLHCNLRVSVVICLPCGRVVSSLYGRASLWIGSISFWTSGNCLTNCSSDSRLAVGSTHFWPCYTDWTWLFQLRKKRSLAWRMCSKVGRGKHLVISKPAGVVCRTE